MVDIQSEIFEKYGVDISKEDIFTLYRIDKNEVLTISEQDLQKKIDETRGRWNSSINSPNERLAQRGRLRLEKADKYEAILKDAELRKKIFYCNEKRDSEEDPLAFAREYFQLLSTTGRIKEKAYKFYFDYFDGEGKKQKAIKEMLQKDFKYRSIKENEKTGEEDEGEEKKHDSDLMVKNNFGKDTLIKLKKCISCFETAKQNTELCQRYPALRESIFELVEMDKMKDIQQFQKAIGEKRQEAYTFRQELGSQYTPLVDLFNNLDKLAKENKDVKDNFSAFKLLMQYPNLSPYMYALQEMKSDTLKEMLNIAKREYHFRDDMDFLLNYYLPLYEHFGLINTGINSLIRKAEKKAGTNKLLKKIDKKLGRKKNKKISIGAELIHWGLYFPIFTVYFVFEVFKVIFTQIHKFTIPLFLLLLLGENWLFPKMSEIENLLIFGKIFSKAQWSNVLETFFDSSINNGFEIILLSLIFIIGYLMIYLLPPLCVSIFVGNTAKDLNSRYDWIGLERTFKNIFLKLRMKTEEQYMNQKELFFKEKAPKIIVNFLCLIITIVLVYFTPKFF